MSPLEIFSQPIWQRLCLVLLHFVWQGCAVAALLLLLAAALGVRRARSRYQLSLAALLVLALCPPLTFLLAANPPHRTAVTTDSPTQPAISTAMSTDYAEASRSDALLAAQPYVSIFHLAGVIVLSGRLMLSFLSIQWLKGARLPVGATLAERVARLSRRLGLRRQARVFVSSRVREAIVVGLWRPLVLLPAAWLAEMSPQVLEAIIAHELAHVRRWDLWVNMLQRILETLLFYHPAVWWLSRRLRLEREMCCDELAVAAAGSPVDYANALEQVARWRLGSPSPTLAAAIRGGKKMNLLDRVRNVLGMEMSRQKARWWPIGMITLALMAGLWFSSSGANPLDGSTLLAQDARDDETSVDELELDERERLELERLERLERERLEREQRERAMHEIIQDRMQARDRDTRDRRSSAVPSWSWERRSSEQPPRRPEMGPPNEALIRMMHELHEEVDQLRRPEMGPSIEALIRLIGELNKDVDQLRREVQQLRAEQGTPRDAYRDDQQRGPRRRSALDRDDERPRDEYRPAPRDEYRPAPPRERYRGGDRRDDARNPFAPTRDDERPVPPRERFRGGDRRDDVDSQFVPQRDPANGAGIDDTIPSDDARDVDEGGPTSVLDEISLDETDGVSSR